MTDPIEAARRGNRPAVLWVLGGVLLLAGIPTLVFALMGGFGAGTPTPSSTPLATSTPTETAEPTPTPTPTPTPEVNTIDRVFLQEVFDTGNTEPLLQEFADEVTVVYPATECCGPLTPDKAIEAITTRITPGTTWNFNPDAATLAPFQASFYGDTSFPPSAYVGVGSSGLVISLVPDADGLISWVFVGDSVLIY